jgi:hypothetical protein
MGFLKIVTLGVVGLGLLASQAAPPIGYWKLDEPASPVEESIAGADGTWNGPVQASTDVPATITFPDCGSLRFRSVAAAGAVNYVSLGRSAALDASQNGSFTLSAWFKPASIPPSTQGDPDTQYGIVLKTGLHEGLSMAGSGFVMGHWVSPNMPPVYVSTGYGTSTAQVGTWYHVAGVVDKQALKVRLFVNGNPPPFNAEADIPAGTPDAWPGYATAPWLLGINDPNGGGARYQADGWIDDVRIYGRALTQSEIQTLSNGGTLGDPVVDPPAAPTNVQATPGTSQVVLTWTPVAGASAYNVKKSTTAGAETNYAIATANNFTDTAVTAPTRYYYVVSALVGCSESPNSAEVSAVPIAPIPPAPRTSKVGNENDPCGCGVADVTIGAGALGLAILLLVLLRGYS